ncbi:MAG: photosynthetic protein synthase I [Proteobacteria bacterium]|nr:photosynthetic protein synthase I [Pseudomonadota bacterium]
MSIQQKPKSLWRPILISTAIAVVFGGYLDSITGVAQQTVQAAETQLAAIGPLPARKAPRASLVEMGKRLFFDARMSGDGAISCATCHDPAQGFTRQVGKEGKPMALSDAYPGTRHFRNAPTLLNSVYKADFAEVGWGWDGHIGANMNDVIRDQITETMMLNLDMRLMHERMKQDAVYVEMCQENFNGECSSGKGRKALVAFVETLVSKDAPFDNGSLSDAAKKGQTLFEGKAGCINCHNGPYFSDGEPHNTGMPENMDVFKDPLRHIAYRAVLTNHGVPNAENWRRDVGFFFVSKRYADVGKFITPTLRELKYTAPYMHNGLLTSLEDVVEFYNQGGGKDDPLADVLQPLGLGAQEQKDLVAFLESLSSTTPVTVEKIKISQEYEPIPNWLEAHN